MKVFRRLICVMFAFVGLSMSIAVVAAAPSVHSDADNHVVIRFAGQ